VARKAGAQARCTLPETISVGRARGAACSRNAHERVSTGRHGAIVAQGVRPRFPCKRRTSRYEMGETRGRDQTVLEPTTPGITCC
jgi:hypothetical protein